MAGNVSKVYIEVEVDGKGGIKVLRQIGTESDKSGKTGAKAFKEMDRSAEGLNAHIKSMHGLLLKLGAGYAIVRAAREMLDLADMASDLNETLSKSENIFENLSADIEAWAEKSDRSLGLSKQAALEHTATLGNMYRQLGAGIDVAAQASQQMVKYAADLASFHNVAGGASAVLEAMQSAFRGEYDALQRYIPTINAAAVQEQALAMTHKENAKELTNLEKALAAQAIIVRDAGAATGDFARTSKEAANQKRILTAQVENLKAKLGERLLPVLGDVYREMNHFLESLSPEDIRFAADSIKILADSFVGLGRAIAKVPSFVMKIAGAMETEVTVLTDVNQIVKENTLAWKDNEAAVRRGAEAHEAWRLSKYKITPPAPPAPSGSIDWKKYWNSEEGKIAMSKALATVSENAHEEWRLRGRYHEATAADLAKTEKAMADFKKAKIDESKEAYADMYDHLQFKSDGYYQYRVQQIKQETDAYAEATGNRVLAHQVYIERIKELDKQREDAANSTNQSMVEFSRRTAEAMEQNFSDLYFDIMMQKYRDLGDYAEAVFRSIVRAEADILGQQTKEALFGSGGTSGLLSKGFDWVGSLFSGGSNYAGAGTRGVTPGSVNWHAKGGTFGPDEWIGVGEKGPEIIYTGNKSGQVIPAGAGNVSIQVNVINNGEPMEQAAPAEVRFDGSKYIADVHIDRMINNRSYRQANRQALRG